MIIKFNGGFKIYPTKNSIQYLEVQKHKEASENISNCLARQKQIEFGRTLK